MGNKHSRRPSNKASIMSTNVSNSFKPGESDINFWSTSKGKGTANTSSATDTGGEDTLGGIKDDSNGVLNLRSWKTGTLDSTAFQPPGYSAKKIEPVAVSKRLSAKAPVFIPAIQVKKADQKEKALAGSSDTPQPSNTKSPNPSDGVNKIQSLIHKMQALPAYNIAPPARYLSDESSAQSSASTISFAASSSQVRESVVRVDLKKKDLMISENGVFRKRFRVDELEFVDGKYIYQPKALFDPTNALGEIADLCEAGKKHFWLNNQVQIIVDLCGFISAPVNETEGDGKGNSAAVDVKGKGKEVATSITIIDQLDNLGEDFLNYATRFTVGLIFPPPRPDSVAFQPHSARGISSNAHFSMVVNTAGFEIIQKLVAKLDKCIRMEFLELIIYNPSASSTIPFTVEQLLHALPFYDLRFLHWKLKWQGNYMSTPVEVGNFPIIILDKERNRWIWHQKKANRKAKIAARKEQDRIDNMVRVTKSIAPDCQKTQNPELVPTAPNAPLEEQKVQANKDL